MGVALLGPLKLQPIYKPRVWGGDRLLPGSPDPIGEAWLVYDNCLVSGGEWDGFTLADVTRQAPQEMLGTSENGAGFPLLVKLLHSTEWLSVQVHPDDRWATELEGPGHRGKTEAWHILEAEDGAQVVFGLTGDVRAHDVRTLVERGELEAALNKVAVSDGDTLFTPAGCVHAIGPGLLTFEVQQTSDITYRLYDWNRPQSAGRELHLDKALTVIGACGAGIDRTPMHVEDRPVRLVECQYFAIDRIERQAGKVELDTDGVSFHAVTVTAGNRVVLRGCDNQIELGIHDTAVVPAVAGLYSLHSDAQFAALITHVP